MVGIIDYGAGNLRSLQNALDFLGFESKIVKSSSQIKEVDKLILPGVGHFGEAAKKLKSSGSYFSILDWIALDKPFLGICVGLQLLMRGSSEALDEFGLGFFGGECKKFTKGKVPQMGWNLIRIEKKDKIFKDFKNIDNYVYFVHSYYPDYTNKKHILATCDYFVKFPAILAKKNVYGFQFHPEKSGPTGLKLLNNWVNL